MRINTDCTVSIIMPIYGVERYLDKAVASIVNQTYRNLQIILVDDGSKDRCPDICDAWADRDSRIQVIHKDNGGLSDARNAGLRECSGIYVCFVDSDDYCDPRMIECMVRAAETHDAQMVICGNHNVDYDDGQYDETGRNIVPASATHSNDEVRALMRDLMQNYVCIPVWNKLYRCSFLLERHAMFDTSVSAGEDSLFNVPLYTVLQRLVCLPDALYNYVSRNGSTCNEFRDYWFHDRREAFRRSWKMLEPWDVTTAQLFANEFVYQVGVILGFLYEDRRPEVRAIRHKQIAEITHDEV
ncbi:glycosyltransferase family 2 protein, partial [Bifidobacterium reuteri]